MDQIGRAELMRRAKKRVWAEVKEGFEGYECNLNVSSQGFSPHSSKVKCPGQP
jgi:hypothetical protein